MLNTAIVECSSVGVRSQSTDAKATDGARASFDASKGVFVLENAHIRASVDKYRLIVVIYIKLYGFTPQKSLFGSVSRGTLAFSLLELFAFFRPFGRLLVSKPFFISFKTFFLLNLPSFAFEIGRER